MLIRYVIDLNIYNSFTIINYLSINIFDVELK